ncbi:N-alpha-acetyltransferase 38, NatC auxiliary subunit [Madurella mycetomatis]|uniref:N-alpha-acetyltransferase 38, NatC auxiliary subunit n=1 Tax=Madurella mycetomatis TaxID=100816 RepID=A0A175WEG3_9PEZI|nr:N-alpha-acetyltransferase 38, NatC auxiliary subunit [Madurella mycetomatis]
MDSTNLDPSSPSSPPPTQEQQQQKQAATDFLHSILNKNLRVTTADSRMFWGTFKCTDSESNLVLQHTYEYRHPTAQQISEAAAGGSDPGNTGKVKLDMTSRYLGLVVVPGRYIVRIEVEEFASQRRGQTFKVQGPRQQEIREAKGVGSG